MGVERGDQAPLRFCNLTFSYYIFCKKSCFPGFVRENAISPFLTPPGNIFRLPREKSTIGPTLEKSFRRPCCLVANNRYLLCFWLKKCFWETCNTKILTIAVVLKITNAKSMPTPDLTWTVTRTISHVVQESQTRGPRERFVRPVLLFGNFQIIDIHLI